MERWEIVEDFDHIGVSNMGRVRNISKDRMISVRVNRQGFLMVSFPNSDRQVFTRSVGMLVAQAFVRNPRPDVFNSIIHLDGDRANCQADNLMWRSRSFAMYYHKMFDNPPVRGSFKIPMKNEIYDSLRELCMKYGLVEDLVYANVLNRHPCFPYSWYVERA